MQEKGIDKWLLAEKCAVTLWLVLWWLAGFKMGYGGNNADEVHDAVGHLVYMWCHAGFWHLAGNLFVLWLMSRPLYLAEGVAIAFACSMLPELPGVWELWPGSEATVTMGFSGVLFGMFGVKWGVYCASAKTPTRCTGERTTEDTRRRSGGHGERLKEFCRRALPWALAGALLPHINWSLHLYCLLAGLAVGYMKASAKTPTRCTGERTTECTGERTTRCTGG